MSLNTTTDGEAIREGLLEGDGSFVAMSGFSRAQARQVDDFDIPYRLTVLDFYLKYTVMTGLLLAGLIAAFAPEKQTVFPLLMTAVTGVGARAYLRRRPEQTRTVAAFVVIQLVFVLLGIDSALPDNKSSVFAAFMFVPILASVVSGDRAAVASFLMAFPLLIVPRVMAGVSIAELADLVALCLSGGVVAVLAASADRRRLLQTWTSRETNLRLRAAVDEAVSLSEAKTMFLASVSHEIRTPMNGVIGLTSALMKTGLDEQQAHLANTVLQSARDLLAILDDVLDTSKLQRGQVTYESIPFDVAEVCRNVVDLHSQAASDKQTSLWLMVSDEVPDFVLGDPVRFRQVLQNLLSNAVKFTSKGEVKVRLYPSSTGVGVSVSDTGIGIPPERQAEVFSTFWQADASTTRRFGGSGLGLSISKTIVEQMGGVISFESAVGVGSTFWFELPFTETERPEDEQTGVGRTIEGVRVLVAEDNEVNQMVISHMLGEMGVTFEIVENGLAAVEAVRRAAWDVVLMDCYMPEMDGFIATRTIREGGGEQKDIPIIAVTASVAAVDRERISRFGMDDVLSKPVDADELMRMVERWLPYMANRDGEPGSPATASGAGDAPA